MKKLTEKNSTYCVCKLFYIQTNNYIWKSLFTAL